MESTAAAGTIIQTARGLGEPFHEIFEGCGPDGFFLSQIRDIGGVEIEDHAFVFAAHQAPHHIGAHAAQSDHSQLHA